MSYLRSYTQEFLNAQHAPALTIGHVALLRTWLQRAGYENVLIIEHVEGRNVLYLRLTQTGKRLPVAQLNRLLRKRTPPEQIHVLVQELAA